MAVSARVEAADEEIERVGAPEGVVRAVEDDRVRRRLRGDHLLEGARLTEAARRQRPRRPGADLRGARQGERVGGELAERKQALYLGGKHRMAAPRHEGAHEVGVDGEAVAHEAEDVGAPSQRLPRPEDGVDVGGRRGIEGEGALEDAGELDGRPAAAHRRADGLLAVGDARPPVARAHEARDARSRASSAPWSLRTLGAAHAEYVAGSESTRETRRLAGARPGSAADVAGRGAGGSSAWLALPAAMSATVATTRHRSGVRVGHDGRADHTPSGILTCPPGRSSFRRGLARAFQLPRAARARPRWGPSWRGRWPRRACRSSASGRIEGVVVVLGDLEHEVRASADARQVLHLLEHEAPDAAPLVVRVHRQLLDEERAHVALLEVPEVDPVVGAADLEGALGVAHDRSPFPPSPRRAAARRPRS